jgi:hypothetical protein
MAHALTSSTAWEPLRRQDNDGHAIYNSEAKPGEKKPVDVYKKQRSRKRKRDRPSPEASPVFKSRLRNDYSRMNVARGSGI